MTASSLPITGGCQCGAVRYALWDAPETIYICHCRECQRQSTSAFGISAVVRAATFKLTQGVPRCWSRPTDSGNVMDCWFCPKCGVRLWHASSGFRDFRSIKGGTLDVAPDLTDAVHLFTGRRIPGIEIPDGATCFDGEPHD